MTTCPAIRWALRNDRVQTTSVRMMVSDVVRAIMYAESYGSYEAGIERFRRSAAAHCGECGQCTVSCPNGVRVEERMRRAQELFC